MRQQNTYQAVTVDDPRRISAGTALADASIWLSIADAPFGRHNVDPLTSLHVYYGSYAGRNPRRLRAYRRRQVNPGPAYEGWYFMATDRTDAIKLINDTRLNVASLLMEDVGSTRELVLTLTSFPLDDEFVASSVLGQFRLTRLRSGVLVTGSVSGDVELECSRCLNLYDQPFSTTLTEQFRQTVDVRSGSGITPARKQPDGQDEDDDELGFEIDDAHEMDLTEMLRQHVLLALPMRPDCGEQCPGPPEIPNEPEAQTDSRFAALEELLDDE